MDQLSTASSSIQATRYVTNTMTGDHFEIYKINRQDQVAAMLETTRDLPVLPPSLYLLIGGSDSITWMTLMILPQSKVYSINISRLGQSSLTIASSNGATLKAILESSVIPKVFFDARHAARMLFRGYQIELDRVHELQVMELATRRDDDHKEKFASFKSLVNVEKPVPPTWNSALQNLQFDQRILVFPQLWALYHQKLTTVGSNFWIPMTRIATRERLLGARYSISKKLAAYSPWDKDLIEEQADLWKRGRRDSEDIFQTDIVQEQCYNL